jgi:hypothetical protein
MLQTTPHSFRKLARVDLHEARNHEARFFTPWLEENLKSMSEAIGVPLRRLQREIPYIQRPRNAGPSDVCERLLALKESLEEQWTAKFLPNKAGRFLLSLGSPNLSDRAGWDELFLWLELTTRYSHQTRREKF